MDRPYGDPHSILMDMIARWIGIAATTKTYSTLRVKKNFRTRRNAHDRRYGAFMEHLERLMHATPTNETVIHISQRFLAGGYQPYHCFLVLPGGYQPCHLFLCFAGGYNVKRTQNHTNPNTNCD